jgi:hypothetical protein
LPICPRAKGHDFSGVLAGSPAADRRARTRRRTRTIVTLQNTAFAGCSPPGFRSRSAKDP